jgi:hypothetical protein
MIDHKTCKRCLVTKDLSKFQVKINNRKTKKDTRNSYVLGTCRACNAMAQKIATMKRLEALKNG